MGEEVFRQDRDTLGLLKIYFSLKKERKITITDKELCAQLDFAPSSFTLIKKGQRNAPEALIDAFLKKFKLTREALQITSSELANDSQGGEQSQATKSGDQSKIIQFLMDQIKVKDAENRNLYSLIDSLNDTIAYFTGKEGDGKKVPKHQHT